MSVVNISNLISELNVSGVKKPDQHITGNAPQDSCFVNVLQKLCGDSVQTADISENSEDNDTAKAVFQALFSGITSETSCVEVSEAVEEKISDTVGEILDFVQEEPVENIISDPSAIPTNEQNTETDETAQGENADTSGKIRSRQPEKKQTDNKLSVEVISVQMYNLQYGQAVEELDITGAMTEATAEADIISDSISAPILREAVLNRELYSASANQKSETAPNDAVTGTQQESSFVIDSEAVLSADTGTKVLHNEAIADQPDKNAKPVADEAIAKQPISQPVAEAKPEIKQEVVFTAEPKAETKATGEVISEQPKTEAKPEIKQEVVFTAEPKAETKAAAGEVISEQPKTEATPEIKQEVVFTAEPKVETKAAADEVISEQPKTEATPEIKQEVVFTAEPKTEAKPEIKQEVVFTAEPKSETKAAADEVIEEQPISQPTAEAKTETKVVFTAEPKPEAESKIKAEAMFTKKPATQTKAVVDEVIAEQPKTESKAVADEVIAEQPKTESKAVADEVISEKPEFYAKPEIKAEAMFNEKPVTEKMPATDEVISEQLKSEAKPEMKDEVVFAEKPAAEAMANVDEVIADHSMLKAKTETKTEVEFTGEQKIKAGTMFTEKPVTKAKAVADEVIAEQPKFDAETEIKTEAMFTGKSVTEAKTAADEVIAKQPKSEAMFTERPVTEEKAVTDEAITKQTVSEPETEIKTSVEAAPESITKAAYHEPSEYQPVTNAKSEIFNEVQTKNIVTEQNPENISSDKQTAFTKVSEAAEAVQIPDQHSGASREQTAFTDIQRMDNSENRTADSVASQFSDSSSNDSGDSKPENNSADFEQADRTTSAKTTDFQTNQPEKMSGFESIMQNTVILNSLDFARASDISMDDTVMEQEISSQTFTALNENIPDGKDEFVIRLSPRGLGDITVKLIKSDGAVLVKMIASNEKTAQLLNRDIDVLQHLLTPHKAEIQQVAYQKPEEPDMKNSFNHNFTDEHSFQKQNDNQERHSYYHGYNNADYSSDNIPDDEPTLQIMPSIIGNTILNRYI